MIDFPQPKTKKADKHKVYMQSGQGSRDLDVVTSKGTALKEQVKLEELGIFPTTQTPSSWPNEPSVHVDMF